MNDSAPQIPDELYSRLVVVRHELHAHPELSYQEQETSRRLAGWLGEIEGLQVRGGLGRGTGLMATLATGRPGPVIALRADMDALPIVEQSGLPWASRNSGVMHACGHDGHMACLLGAATVLAQLRDRLAGTIRFIFQPAEEGGAGAAAMIADGVLDDEGDGPVAAIFGLHGWPGRKVGQASTRPGAVMASTDTIRLALRGKGAHGAYPHVGRDPIAAAGYVLVALQSIVARTVDPTRSAVVTIGRIHGGTAVNVIPDAVELAGTIRALDEATRNHLRSEVGRVVRATAEAHGVTADLEIVPGYPVAVNDERMTQLVAETARELLGEANFTADQPPSTGGEDFAYYLQRVPGCFFFIGTCPADRSDYAPIHTPHYDFTDEAIRTGVRMLCGLAIRGSDGALGG